jgi:acyl-CoA thioester hydrolase
MPRHVYFCKMRWSDMDAYGHVNNVVYLTFLEEARVDMFAPYAQHLQDHSPDGGFARGVVIAKHEISYLRPLVFRAEPVRVETWVTRIGVSSYTLGYEVRDEDVVYASAASVLVPYDVQAARPRRLRDAERAVLEPYLESV